MNPNNCLPILACLVLSASHVACASDVSGDNPGEITIDIDSDSQNAFNPEIHGFNTNFTRGPYGVNNRKQRELLKEMNPAVVRFPGGWLSEYYHWGISGYKKAELDQEGQRGSRTWSDFNKRFKAKLSFDEFMSLAQSVGFRPVIEVNLTTGSPEESAAWVRHVRDKGYDVAAWELGNELYGRKARETFPDVKDYITVARQHANAMRMVDPQIRIAVVASPAGVRKVRKPSRYYTRWDQEMGKESFYDAYVVHAYPHLYDYTDRDLPVMADYLMPYSDFVFDDGRAWYQKHYGSKPAWMTEWNLLPIDTQVANTQLHALYCGDFLVQLYRNSDWIEIAQFHVLGRFGMGFPVISPPHPGEQRPTKDPVRRACFFPMKLAGQLNRAASTSLAVSIRGQVTRPGSIGFSGTSYPVVNAAAFRGRDGQYLLLITNRGPDALDVALTIDGKPTKAGYKLSIIGGGSLSASNGGNERLGISNSMDVGITNRSGMGPHMTLDPYSVTLLESE